MELNETKADYVSLKRTRSELDFETIKSSTQAVDYCRRFYGDDIDVYESVFAIFMDNSGRVIAWTKISQGGIAASIIDVRIVTKLALDTLATQIIICHNHPSGNLNPSKADIRVTEELKQCLGFFKIRLLDHFIISSDGYNTIS